VRRRDPSTRGVSAKRSRPSARPARVRLTLEQNAEPVNVIRVWADQPSCPKAVAELREELGHDLHDAASRREGD
jgi:hypothetical protein